MIDLDGERGIGKAWGENVWNRKLNCIFLTLNLVFVLSTILSF